MIKLNPPKINKSYAEIGQNVGTQFAFVNKVSEEEYSQIHTEFKCRDFLGDCIYATEIGKPVTFWGFTFDPKIHKLDTDKTRMFITNYPECFKANQCILRQIEIANGFEQTQFHYLDKKGVIIEGDIRWQSSLFMISMYSFIFKVMSYPYKTEDWVTELLKAGGTNESHYVKRVGEDKVRAFSKGLLGKIPNEKDTVSGYPPNKPQNHMHDYTGWVTLGEKKVPDNTISCRIHDLLAA